METTPQYYHITWNDSWATTYYAEGKKGADGSLLALRYRAISHILNGKRVRFKTPNARNAGLFPAPCKFRKLKKNPFKS